MTRHLTTHLVWILGLSLALGACQEEISAPASMLDQELTPEASSHSGPDVPTQAALAHELNAVRAATTPYRDIAEARADGYVVISPYVPGMGFHFTNRFPPFGTDREGPPVLVYFPNESYDPAPGEALDPAHEDDLILGAVEYLVPGDQTDAAPDIFADEDSPRTLKTTEEEGWHFEEAEGFTGLHAWVHRGNPAGVFHPTNPGID